MKFNYDLRYMAFKRKPWRDYKYPTLYVYMEYVALKRWARSYNSRYVK